MYSLGFVDITIQEQGKKLQDFDKNPLVGVLYQRKKYIETFRLGSRHEMMRSADHRDSSGFELQTIKGEVQIC